MATLTPIAGPPITVTALTAINGATGQATFSGSSLDTNPPVTGVTVISSTSLQIALGRISAFA